MKRGNATMYLLFIFILVGDNFSLDSTAFASLDVGEEESFIELWTFDNEADDSGKLEEYR